MAASIWPSVSDCGDVPVAGIAANATTIRALIDLLMASPRATAHTTLVQRVSSLVVVIGGGVRGLNMGYSGAAVTARVASQCTPPADESVGRVRIPPSRAQSTRRRDRSRRSRS